MKGTDKQPPVFRYEAVHAQIAPRVPPGALSNWLFRVWPWLLVGVLWVVATLNYLDRQVIFSIFPLLEHDLHASSIELGLTSTVFLLTYALLSPFAGYIADRFGRSRAIVASLIVWSIACLIAGHVHTIFGMLWSRAGMGVSEAFYIPAALALIVESHGEKSKSLATGIHQTGCYTGIILGGALGGMAGQRFGWRPLFRILGIVGVVYAIFLWAMLKLGLRQRPGGNPARLDIRPLLRSRPLMLFAGVFGAYSGATWILYTWLPLYLYEQFHMSLAAAGFEATFWLQTASYAGAFAGGFVADRWAGHLPHGRLWVQIIGLALACPFLVALTHTRSLLFVVLALVSVGLGRGSFDANTTPVLVRLVNPKLCSTSYGVLNCVGSITGGLAALTGGWLRQRNNFSLMFEVAAFSVALAVFGLVLLTRHLREAPPARGYSEVIP
jgi:MFS transporter, Spinster family, sphingosine-1-phosphate transporter